MSDTGNSSGRRHALKGVLALGAAPAIITSAKAQTKVRWKVQTIWPKASPSFSGSIGVMAKKLAERTDGRFQLEPLAAGEIAKGSEVFNVVRRGVVPMGATSPAYNLDEAELMGHYMGVPGTLRQPWEMMHLTKNLGLEDALNEELQSKGVFMKSDKALGQELVLKKKIEPGTDLSGLKMGSAGTMLQYLSAAGFAAQRAEGPDLYQSLATGVIDGTNWGGTQGALAMKLWEVAPVHMRPALQISNDVYVINLAAWNKLPDDLRDVLAALFEEHHSRRSVQYQHQEAVALRTGLEKMNVSVEQFPPEAAARMAEASRELIEKESAKGPKAKEMSEQLLALMKDVGYA